MDLSSSQLRPFTIFILLLLIFINFYGADQRNRTGPRNGLKCPDGITSPCSCAVSLPSHNLAIHCIGGASLAHILHSLEPLRMTRQEEEEEDKDKLMVLDILRIENTPIPVLYLDSLRSLPPVRRLFLHNNSLAHVLHRNSPSLAPLLDNLEELAITANSLSNFGDFSPTLAMFRSLRSLSLSANKLAAVPPHTFLRFHSRNQIEELDLSDNLFGDDDSDGLPVEAFLGMASLRKLSLDRNQLRRIPAGACNELGDSLEELYLGANQIESLMGEEDEELLALPRLRTLGMDANKISAISGENLRGLPSLLYLYLSNNLLSAIPADLFAFVSELKVLVMSGNPIERIDEKTFQLIPSLFRLELARCQITQIDDHSFWHVPKLQFVHLGNNKLSWIGSHLFAGKMPFLISLDLSNNLISRIDDFAFADLVQLQQLDLSGNDIVTMGPGTFDLTFFANSGAIDQMRELNLIGNPLDCRPEQMAWSDGFGHGLRLKGSCAQPAEWRGIQIAQLKGKPEATITMITTTERYRMSPEMQRIIATQKLCTTTTKPMRATELDREPIEGRTELEGRRMAKLATRGGREGAKQNWIEQQESNVVHLWIVAILVITGVMIVALLVIRQLIRFPAIANGHPKSSQSKMSITDGVKRCWDKLKMFFRRRSASSSFSVHPPIPQPRRNDHPPCLPTMLTTLNHLKQKDDEEEERRRKMMRMKEEEGRMKEEEWRMEDEEWRMRGMKQYPIGKEGEMLGPDPHQQMWRIRREMFWF